MQIPVYMDCHATTPMDARVVTAMLRYFTEIFGNPGSTGHRFGEEAKAALQQARQTVASVLGTTERAIVFTSGATESNNLAIRGVTDRKRLRGKHVVSIKTEHKAVLDPLQRLSRQGFEVQLLTPLPIGHPQAGLVDLQQFEESLRGDTCLVSVMLANNEVGVIQPIAEMAKLCREREIVFHCDATQAVGKIPVDAEALGVDLLSFSGHKIYGPRGVGGLYVRRGDVPVRLEPLQLGGGQEGGLRSGTVNVPGAVGLAMALTLCAEELSSEMPRLAQLRQRLWVGLKEQLPDASLNGPEFSTSDDWGAPGTRLPGNLNCAFPWVDGEALMMSNRNVAVSSGSACTSASPEPSHVLMALGLGADLTRASLRFGLGRLNTTDEVDFAVREVASTVRSLRQHSSMT
ncbi:MAG: cysteine desulfurase family protein [Planctomycetaceae bacterium]